MMDNRLLSIALVLSFIVMGNMTYAQAYYKTVNGKTYVYDNAKKTIYNKNNKIASDAFATEGFEVENYLMVAETFGQLFSAERIKELERDMVAVVFDCDIDGKIGAVSFIFAKTPFLTPTEVDDLEQAFFKKSFKINSNLEKGTRIGFAIPCFFSRLKK